MTLWMSKNTAIELMGKKLRKQKIDVILQNSVSNVGKKFQN